MSEPYLGEIKIVGFNFAPRNWAQCDGKIMPIAQNQSLYSLLGTTWGGDGRTSFALPDLRGRVPISQDFNYFQCGRKGGEETVVLDVSTMPSHTHAVKGTTSTGDKFAGKNTRGLASSNDQNDMIYGRSANLTSMNSGVVTPFGGSQAHVNVQPIQVVNFCIAIRGLYPSRN